MAIVNNTIIKRFDKLTKFDLSRLLFDYSQFISSQRNNVVNYYAGIDKKPDKISFQTLEDLIKRFKQLNNVIENHKNRLQEIVYWELIDTISDIEISLDTIDNSSKWLRSAIAKNDFTPGLEVNHTLKMFQTLEDVSRIIQGSNNPQNAWTTIALRNDLIEEGYTVKGGNQLKIGFKNNATIQIKTVVDTINGESIYGKDFQRKLNIVDEDLLVLNEKETIKQSVYVLSSLKQGDTPEFKGEGISASLVVGSNRATITYPILFRQIFNTFQKDDTLKSLRVTDISTKKDGIFIEVQVETRLGELITIETQI